MEQATLPSAEETSAPQGCVSCGHPIVQEGYAARLCSDCRQKFINYPIPLGVRIFGMAILALSIFATIKFWGNLSAGIHYEKGKTAIAKSNYFTAETELNKVVKKIPGFIDARVYLAVASFYNNDMQTFAKTAQTLDGKEVKDEGIYRELQDIIQKSTQRFPSDSLFSLYHRYVSFDSIPQETYDRYVASYPDELFASARYAALLLDKKEYAKSDSLVNRVLQKDNAYFDALALKAALKRELRQFDSAHYYCDRMLALNRESTYGMSAKARTYLQEKNDAEGLKWARRSYDFDPADPYSMATLALAFHYNNSATERDKLIETLKSDSTGSVYLQYVLDVMSNKEKFRD